MARRTVNVDKPGMRWCPKCEAHLPVEKFGAMPSHFDGLDPYCKEHRKEARKVSRVRVRDRLRANKEARNLTDKQVRKLASEILSGIGYDEIAGRLASEVHDTSEPEGSVDDGSE
jgi:hypothetical protein